MANKETIYYKILLAYKFLWRPVKPKFGLQRKPVLTSLVVLLPYSETHQTQNVSCLCSSYWWL